MTPLQEALQASPSLISQVPALHDKGLGPGGDGWGVGEIGVPSFEKNLLEALLTRSPIWVWSPWGRMSMSGCKEQASMTILYLEWGGAGTQLLSLTSVGPEHWQRVISLQAAVPG